MAFVPFAHSVLGTGEYAAQAAAWATHDARWALLVGEYRLFFTASPPFAALMGPGVVERINEGVAGPGWPYIPAAPEEEEPGDPWSEAWPLQSARLGGVTQEGLLSQSPPLFAQLQQMVLEWEAALHAAPPTAPPPPPTAPPPAPVTPPTDLSASLPSMSHLMPSKQQPPPQPQPQQPPPPSPSGGTHESLPDLEEDDEEAVPELLSDEEDGRPSPRPVLASPSLAGAGADRELGLTWSWGG
eukprot:4320791-Prymnesium_polylepis.1